MKSTTPALHDRDFHRVASAIDFIAAHAHEQPSLERWRRPRAEPVASSTVPTLAGISANSTAAAVAGRGQSIAGSRFRSSKRRSMPGVRPDRLHLFITVEAGPGESGAAAVFRHGFTTVRYRAWFDRAASPFSASGMKTADTRLGRVPQGVARADWRRTIRGAKAAETI
jgi:hypothetical protein